MSTVGKPKWQQLTALVSLSAGGTIAGMSFVPGTHADVTSPSKVPLRLVALERLSQPAQASAPSDDAALRSAIVNVARYYLQMAKDKTPAEMESMIWQHVSVDGADHGPSCAAFASLTLELGAQVVGQQSWVTEGTTYPWPLHAWADVRVDPNSDSLGIISIQQDAQAHGRWHALGDGYQPQPGDWVMFDGHVEVVTGYSGGVLSTIGGDSLPNYTVNAHTFSGPLGAQGVQGFVDNGSLAKGTGTANGAGSGTANGSTGAANGAKAGTSNGSGAAAANGSGAAAPNGGSAGSQPAQPSAAIPGVPAAPGVLAAPTPSAGQPAAPAASIPGASASGSPGSPSAQPRGSAAVPGVSGSAAAPASNAQPQHPAPAAGASTAHGGHSHTAPQAPAGKGASGATSPAGGPGTAARAAGTNGSAAIPGVATAPQPSAASAGPASAEPPSGPAGAPAAPAVSGSTAQARSSAAIPGITGAPQPPPAAPAPATPAPASSPATGSSQPNDTPPATETSPQRAFIAEVAPGAMATQHAYGVPAAVTIAQAILESGWGTSHLSSADHNLFGMKGRGPAGSDALPTQEYQNGQWVTTTALFRKYDNYAESIDDHGRLLATSGYYKRAMAAGLNADAFANALTGVYATDPDYGAKLVSLMNEFDLYQYDTAPAAAPAAATPAPAKATPTPTSRARPTPTSSRTATAQPKTSPAPTAPASRPAPTKRSTPAPRPTPTKRSTPAPTPRATPAAARRTRAAHAPVAATLAAAFRPAAASSAFGSAVSGAAFRPAVSGSALRAGAAGPALRTPQRPAPARRATPYVAQIPMQVKNAFVAFAKVPLTSAEPLYRDVASYTGIGWELLAACDWMECEARPDHSPVYGEKLGTPNPDGTIYRTKSEALEQCACDLVDLARAVYRIDLSGPGDLSVRDLASAFAAFRWGALLKLHHTSAMEFPYSVAGLTDRHLAMHWPAIDEPKAPDKPGTRFRLRFGAVPTVLCLRYPATAA